jgi:hypothetical protein
MRLNASVRTILVHGEKRLELPPGEYLIGRSPECAIRLDDPHVSRVHLRLCVGAEGLAVEDMGGKNPARVNGTRLVRSTSLADGDELRIGAACFRVELEPGAAAYHEDEDTITLTGEGFGPRVVIAGCPGCNSVVEEDAVECPHCGRRIRRRRTQELPILDDR